jgi:hypothetical protein
MGDEAAPFFKYSRRGCGGGARPLATRAQSTAQIRRIVVRMAYADNNQEAQARVATFRDVQKLGWIEGRNIRIDARWSRSDAVGRTTGQGEKKWRYL